MSESLGRWHFWLTLIFAYSTFLPMHFTGLAGEPRHYAQLTGIPGPGGALSPAGQLLSATLPLNRHITASALLLAAAQFLFLYNLIRSLRRGDLAPQNPWQSTTLEWHPALHPVTPLVASDDEIIVYRPPCQYGSALQVEEFFPQWLPEASPTESKSE